MMKKTAKIFIVFLLIFFASCAQNPGKVLIKTDEKTISVDVEVADDKDEMAMGLMNRQGLPNNSGMLFVFEAEGHHTFWMKNTLIPLDMIFISNSGKIVDIKHAVPCLADPCETYRPGSPAKYVLEVTGNFTIRNNVDVDDEVEIII